MLARPHQDAETRAAGKVMVVMLYLIQMKSNISARVHQRIEDGGAGLAVPHPLRLRQIEAIEIHHLVPRVHEIAHERLLPVVTSVNFREGAELGV